MSSYPINKPAMVIGKVNSMFPLPTQNKGGSSHNTLLKIREVTTPTPLMASLVARDLNPNLLYEEKFLI